MNNSTVSANDYTNNQDFSGLFNCNIFVKLSLII